MAIRSIDHFVNAIWDWDILNGCFDEKGFIKPTDVDGLVERNGMFLLLEAKSPGFPIKMGQFITQRALIRTGCFTIVNIWGDKNSPEKVQVVHPSEKQEVYDPADLETLRGVVRSWYKWASNQKRAA